MVNYLKTKTSNSSLYAAFLGEEMRGLARMRGNSYPVVLAHTGLNLPVAPMTFSTPIRRGVGIPERFRDEFSVGHDRDLARAPSADGTSLAFAHA